MSKTQNADPFFIGWHPVPRAHRLSLLSIAIVVVAIGVVTALVVSIRQRSPGSAVWEDESQSSVEGIVYASPYAMIRIPGEPVRTVLLVEEGKYGASERVKPFDGQPVKLTGTMLHRDDRQMMELAEGEAAIQIVPMTEKQADTLRRSMAHNLKPVTLTGEIVDSKCYLGAMKPSGGKTHKGCAVLCLKGGVPPMFVTRDAEGHETFYLLTGSDGGPADEAILPFVGDPVQVTGQVESVDDLLVLRVASTNIRRY
jgi:hypothetical protein